MALGWMTRNKPKEDEEEGIEVKPPKEITEKLDKIDGLSTSVDEIKTKFAILDEMGTFLSEQKRLREEAKQRQLAEQSKVKTDKTAEEVEQLWLEDPKKAFEMQSQDLKIGMLNAQSMNIRREVFDDEGEFEYYTGDFKKEVDNLIENSLNPQNRVDPASIKNCYYLVLGRKQKDIKEGKLKSRFAAMTSNSGKSGDGSGKSGDGTIVLSDEMKSAAAKLGVKPEDYAKNAREMGYV
jgi:phage I-like protein